MSDQEHHDQQHHIVGLKTYFMVITSLMVLTAITVWAAFNDFGAANTVVALAIAAVKTVIVAAIFMHLKYSARINWAFAVAGIVFLMIMISFVAADIQGRHWQYRAQGWDVPLSVEVPGQEAHHP